MNQKAIDDHVLSELIRKIGLYLEEPGDPMWETLRFEIEAEFKLKSNILKEAIWKAMVFDTLFKAYNDDPEIFIKAPVWVTKMLTDSFKHLNKHYEQTLLDN
jgi:hypothetical protein